MEHKYTDAANATDATMTTNAGPAAAASSSQLWVRSDGGEVRAVSVVAPSTLPTVADASSAAPAPGPVPASPRAPLSPQCSDELMSAFQLTDNLVQREKNDADQKYLHRQTVQAEQWIRSILLPHVVMERLRGRWQVTLTDVSCTAPAVSMSANSSMAVTSSAFAVASVASASSAAAANGGTSAGLVVPGLASVLPLVLKAKPADWNVVVLDSFHAAVQFHPKPGQLVECCFEPATATSSSSQVLPSQWCKVLSYDAQTGDMTVRTPWQMDENMVFHHPTGLATRRTGRRLSLPAAKWRNLSGLARQLIVDQKRNTVAAMGPMTAKEAGYAASIFLPNIWSLIEQQTKCVKKADDWRQVTLELLQAFLVGRSFLILDNAGNMLPAIVVSAQWINVTNPPAMHNVVLRFTFPGWSEQYNESREMDSPKIVHLLPIHQAELGDFWMSCCRNATKALCVTPQHKDRLVGVTTTWSHNLQELNIVTTDTPTQQCLLTADRLVAKVSGELPCGDSEDQPLLIPLICKLSWQSVSRLFLDRELYAYGNPVSESSANAADC